MEELSYSITNTISTSWGKNTYHKIKNNKMIQINIYIKKEREERGRERGRGERERVTKDTQIKDYKGNKIVSRRSLRCPSGGQCVYA